MYINKLYTYIYKGKTEMRQLPHIFTYLVRPLLPCPTYSMLGPICYPLILRNV